MKIKMILQKKNPPIVVDQATNQEGEKFVMSYGRTIHFACTEISNSQESYGCSDSFEGLHIFLKEKGKFQLKVANVEIIVRHLTDKS